MKALKIFEKFEEKSDPIHDMGIGVKGLDIYTEIWTIIERRGSEIDKVYTKKEYAIRACEEKNKTIYDNNKHSYRSDYIVKSLADAIDIIKDAVRDNAADPGEDY